MTTEELKNLHLNGKNLEELHKELWMYMEENPLEDKYEKAEQLAGEPIVNGCFACYYSLSVDDCVDPCQYCPICDQTADTGCLNGLYTKFMYAAYDKELEQAIFYAKEILDLPWRW